MQDDNTQATNINQEELEKELDAIMAGLQDIDKRAEEAAQSDALFIQQAEKDVAEAVANVDSIVKDLENADEEAADAFEKISLEEAEDLAKDEEE
jgi:hypothetical protein